MARRKYTPVNDFAGNPNKVGVVSLGKEVEMTIEQWPTGVHQMTMSIPVDAVDQQELKFYGWEPKQVGDRVILQHRGILRNGWPEMIMREFVKETA